MFDKLDFWPPISPSTIPRAWPMGQSWKILYLISSTLQVLRFDIPHDHVWQNWIFDPPLPHIPQVPSPGHDPFGQIWKMLYLISSTLQALRFDMLHDHVWQNLDFCPPPRIPQVPLPGHDMIRHVWQNFIFACPLRNPSPSSGMTQGSHRKTCSVCFTYWVPDCIHKILYF